MRELPKNPNTRPPYSDVYLELDYYTGQIVQYLGISKKDMGNYEWGKLEEYLKRLDQAMLRTRAVLDPVTLNDEEWEKASNHTAFDLFDKEKKS